MPLMFMKPVDVAAVALPPNYTLYEDLMILLEGLEISTSVICMRTMERSALQEYAKFLKKLNAELIRILSMPLKKTIPFRRFFIEDSFRLGCLVFISAMINNHGDWEAHCDHLILDLREKLLDSQQTWGRLVETMLHLVMKFQKSHSEVMVHYVTRLMEVLIVLDWEAWKQVRESILRYFLTADICSGANQDLWRCRMEL